MSVGMDGDNQVILFPGVFRDPNGKLDNLHGGNGGGTSGGMESRIARLESDMAHVKDSLKSLDGRVEGMRTDIVAIKVDLSGLKVKVDHLPSKGFIFTVATGLLAAVGGITAMIVRFIPHV